MKNIEIARVLLDYAPAFPEALDGPPRKVEPFEIAFGTFKIRCLPTAPALRAVAAKFARGERKFLTKGNGPLPRHTLRRPKGSDEVLAALADPVLP